jgi:hypothetical protein
MLTLGILTNLVNSSEKKRGIDMAKEVKELKEAKSEPKTRAKSVAQKDKYFWVVDGTVIRSVKEMAYAVDAMDLNVFHHHVNNERNDFANWVEGIFGLKNLGMELRGTTNKDRTVIITLKHLVK